MINFDLRCFCHPAEEHGIEEVEGRCFVQNQRLFVSRLRALDPVVIFYDEKIPRGQDIHR